MESMMFATSSRQSLISTGNENLDKFLGGGLLNSSLNLFERQGPSSRLLDDVINKSIATTALKTKKALLLVNFNTFIKVEKDKFLRLLPAQLKIRSKLLYEDIRGKSETQKIKIAWRYHNQGTSSPTDSVSTVDQVSFRVPFLATINKEDLNLQGNVEIINVDQNEPIAKVISSIRQKILDLKISQTDIVVIIQDLLHPFSPVNESESLFIKLIYSLRCLSRLLTRGAIVVSYDLDLYTDYSSIKQELFNIADCVVSFYSYETGENLITGYKDIDGTLSHIKVPKINSFGFHFQRGLSDWGYRVAKENCFFVVDELSLPPCDDAVDERIKNKMLAKMPDKLVNIQSPKPRIESFADF